MIGQQFGNYRVLSLLGEGGMGAVYLAEHPGIGRRVAVKVLHRQFSGDEQLLGRLLNEARAANAIRHPNIIEILDSGMSADGTPYLVMELLEGESLGQRLRRAGALAIGEAVALTLQTASALGAAHKKGIVHRDLKPDNLFVVGAAGGAAGERIKVLDFGIAKLQMPQPGDSVKTRTGTLMGTPIYMSPEQCRGTKTVDHRSDVYSLGVIFHEMLVGRPPFVSEGFGELVNMHLNVPPPSARAARPEVTEQVDAIILRMLAKNPEDRYPDMASLSGALRLAAGPPFSAQRSSPEHTPSVAAGVDARAPARDPALGAGVGEETLHMRSRGWGKIAGALVGVAALGAGAFLMLGGAPPERAPVAAQPAVTAAPAAPTPPPAPEPAAKATVTVRLASAPAGASVFETEAGSAASLLGTTPLSVTRARGAAFKVRLEKEGYASATREVPLDVDQSLEFALERKAAPRTKMTAAQRSRAKREPDDGPAKL
jgi:serine/threonine-protein kinase